MSKNTYGGNWSHFGALPVSNPQHFSHINAKNYKALKSQVVLSVPPEESEKCIATQRVPLMIETLHNNWLLRGQEESIPQPNGKSGGMRTTTIVELLGVSPSAGNRNRTRHASVGRERERSESDRVRELARNMSQTTGAEGEVEVQPAAVEPLNDSGEEDRSANVVGMEEVTDQLRQSGLQKSGMKRHHLAEQALMEEEREAQAVTGDHCSSTPSNLLGDRQMQTAESGVRKNNGEDANTPPPAKHGRAN